MQATVFVPMHFAGASSETRGSCDVLPESDSIDRRSPGTIAPPAKQPCASTAEMVVAVPMSMTMSGGRCR